MWSTVATAFKLGLNQLSLLSLLAGASFSSLLCLTVFLIVNKQLLTALAQLPRYWKQTLVLAGLNPLLYYLVLFQSYDLLPAQIAQSLNYTWVITLTLLSVPFLKHQLTKGDLIAVVLGYSGVVSIIFGAQKVTGEINLTGILLGLASAFIWAFYWLQNTKDNRPPIQKLFHSFLLATPVLIALAFGVDGLAPFTKLEAWQYMGYIGLFEMGLAFIFWQLALEKASRVGQISSLVYLSPLLSLVIINQTLDEPISVFTLFGLGMILAGIAIQQLLSAKQSR